MTKIHLFAGGFLAGNLVAGWHNPDPSSVRSAMTNPRKSLKQELMDDPSRRIVVDGEIHFCEGQKFKPHQCRGGIEMNESIFTRNHIRHLTESKKAYFWHKFNASLVCTWFHQKHGHTSKFRNWWIARLGNLYGARVVLEWIENAPLRIKQ